MKTLKTLVCRLLAAGAMLAAALPLASAATVYDNGAPNHVSGNNMGFAFQAEDFSLAAGTSLTGVTFWSLEGADEYRGSISWAIVSDNGGSPTGSILAIGRESGVTRTSLGTYLDLTEYSNTFSLGSLALGAGTYWLVLHNGDFGDLGDPNEFLWETTAANGTTRGMESFNDGVTWTSNLNEHAFQVSAVPEPSSILMLAAGLLAVGLRRREQSRRFGK